MRATEKSHSLLSGLGLKGRMQQVIAMVKAVGPYAAIELVLPGGSLIVVLLWLYRRFRGTWWNAA